MTDDKKVLLTADQAIALLAPGETVHNFSNPRAGMLIGCDWERETAILALREAKQIEMGGEECMAMKHPIVCWDADGTRYSFFEADMGAVRAFEAGQS